MASPDAIRSDAARPGPDTPPPLPPAPSLWRAPLLVLGRVVQLTASLFLAWLFFQQFGHQLTTLPDESQLRALWNTANGLSGGD